MKTWILLRDSQRHTQCHPKHKNQSEYTKIYIRTNATLRLNAPTDNYFCRTTYLVFSQTLPTSGRYMSNVTVDFPSVCTHHVK